MANTSYFYNGASYPLNPQSEGYAPLSSNYYIPAHQIGLATDARTSNQVGEVVKKLRTGAKTIEISPSIDPAIFDAIPKHHFKEINRLKKLAGVDLTLHGPMIEPSGFNPRAGFWEETQRKLAENQLQQAVERGHELDPKGNLVITFHTAYSIPETEIKVKEKDKEVTKGLYYINEENGRVEFLELEKQRLTGKELTPKELIGERNSRAWSNTVETINAELINSKRYLRELPEELPQGIKKEEIEKLETQALKIIKENPDMFHKYLKDIESKNKAVANIISDRIERRTSAEITIRDAYNRLNDLFNLAYKSAEKENRQKDISALNKYSEKVAKTIEENRNNPLNFEIFRDQVSEGLRVISSIQPPTFYKPLKDFALEKGAETYANISYNAFKKFKDHAPIISIENPPAGTSALSRGEDLKEMVKLIRKKFVENAIKDGFSKGEAERQAEKLIGATWDVGHINMLRKYGYKEKDIIKETKKIAPYVKHVHLSDNFGMEHTELPMGMGNVPSKEMLKIISKYNEKVKKISETGGPWYQFFQREPLHHLLKEFNSPIYTTQLSPTFEQAGGMMAGYFGGLGNILPETHLSTYGAGFTTLPPELGGQGTGQQRGLGGVPIE